MFHVRHSVKAHLDHRELHSFPTRRSSDLGDERAKQARGEHDAPCRAEGVSFHPRRVNSIGLPCGVERAAASHSSTRRSDRKSTRLNSSHRCISYAVFCLKKKKKKNVVKAT